MIRRCWVGRKSGCRTGLLWMSLSEPAEGTGFLTTDFSDERGWGKLGEGTSFTVEALPVEDDQTGGECQERDRSRLGDRGEGGGIDVVGAEAWAGDDGFDGDAIDDQGAGEHGQAEGALLILPGEIGWGGGLVGG